MCDCVWCLLSCSFLQKMVDLKNIVCAWSSDQTCSRNLHHVKETKHAFSVEGSIISVPKQGLCAGRIFTQHAWNCISQIYSTKTKCEQIFLHRYCITSTGRCAMKTTWEVKQWRLFSAKQWCCLLYFVSAGISGQLWHDCCPALSKRPRSSNPWPFLFP